MQNSILALQDQFLPEKYGLPSIFDNITYSPAEKLFLYNYEFALIDQEYDCLTASLHLKKCLKEQDINCKLCVGTDELNLFKHHTFVELSDGTLLDALPMFDFVNPKHIKKGYISEEQIREYESKQSDFGPIELFPLRFEQPLFLSMLGIKYFSAVGTSRLRNPVQVIYYVQHSIDKDNFVLQFDLNSNGLEKLISDSAKNDYFLQQTLKDLPYIRKLIKNCRNAIK